MSLEGVRQTVPLGMLLYPKLQGVPRSKLYLLRKGRRRSRTLTTAHAFPACVNSSSSYQSQVQCVWNRCAGRTPVELSWHFQLHPEWVEEPLPIGDFMGPQDVEEGWAQGFQWLASVGDLMEDEEHEAECKPDGNKRAIQWQREALSTIT